MGRLGPVSLGPDVLVYNKSCLGIPKRILSRIVTRSNFNFETHCQLGGEWIEEVQD